MEYILVVLLTIFSIDGGKKQQTITLKFDTVESCRDVRNMVNVGLSFYDLASKNTNYSAYVGQCALAKTKKAVKLDEI